MQQSARQFFSSCSSKDAAPIVVGTQEYVPIDNDVSLEYSAPS